MRVTDHTNYKSSQDMYLRQPERANQSTQTANVKKADEKAADAADKTLNREEKAAARRSGAPSQKEDDPSDPIKQLQQRAEAVKKSFEASRHSTLYSSTADLMAIANTESQEVLRAIYVRLSFKLWSVRAAGVTNTNKKAIKNATRSIEKVMGKVKGKIKSLQKEDEMEKRRRPPGRQNCADSSRSCEESWRSKGKSARTKSERTLQTVIWNLTASIP